MKRLWALLFSLSLLVSVSAAGQSSGPATTQPQREMLFPNPGPPVTTILPDAPSYQPLTPKQKFNRFFDDASSPYVFGGALITAVKWQWRDKPPFGSGSIGFAEGYGAAVAQREASLLLSRFLIPVAFHQDPRYFPAPDGRSKLYRATYAASRVLMTRSDSGGQTWNASYILGNLGSAGIANLYISNRDAGTIFSDFAVGMGTDAGYNILREFWPSVRKRVPGKRVKQIGDLLIGAPKPEPSKAESSQH